MGFSRELSVTFIFQAHVMGIFCRSRDELDLAPVIPDESVNIVEALAPLNKTRTLFPNVTSVLADFKSKELSKDHQPTYMDKAQKILLLQKLKTEQSKESSIPGRFIGPTDHINQCHQEMLADTFLVLWKALEFSRTESTMVVYRNLDEQDVRFEMKGDAVVQDFITWSDVWFFIVAIAVNIIFAGLLACIGTAKLKLFCTEFLLNDFNGKRMLCTASHRLDHEISSRLIKVTRLGKLVSGSC